MTTPALDLFIRQLSCYGYGKLPFTNQSWRSFRLTSRAVFEGEELFVKQLDSKPIHSFLLGEMRSYLTHFKAGTKDEMKFHFCPDAMVCLIACLMKTGDEKAIEEFANMLKDKALLSNDWLHDARLSKIVQYGLKHKKVILHKVILFILGRCIKGPVLVKEAVKEEFMISNLSLLLGSSPLSFVDVLQPTDPFLAHLVQRLHYLGYDTKEKVEIKKESEPLDQIMVQTRKEQLISLMVHFSILRPFAELGTPTHLMKIKPSPPNKWGQRLESMMGSEAHPFEYLLRLAQIHPCDPSVFQTDEEEVLLATVTIDNALLKESSWKMFLFCEPKKTDAMVWYESIMKEKKKTSVPFLSKKVDYHLTKTIESLFESASLISSSSSHSSPMASPLPLQLSLLKPDDIFLGPTQTSVPVPIPLGPYPKRSSKPFRSHPYPVQEIKEMKQLVYYGAPNTCQLNRCALNCVIESLYALPLTHQKLFPEKLQKIMEQRSLDQSGFGARIKSSKTESQQMLYNYVEEQKVLLPHIGSHLPIVLLLQNAFGKSSVFQFDPQTKMEDLHVGFLAVQHPGTLQSVCERAYTKGYQVPPVLRILFQVNNRGLKKSKSVPSFQGTGAQCVQVDSLHTPFMLNNVWIQPQSIVFGDGGHFTAQIKLKDGSWYAYNDLMDLGKMRYLGDKPALDNGFWKQQNILYLIAIS